MKSINKNQFYFYILTAKEGIIFRNLIDNNIKNIKYLLIHLTKDF